MIHHNQLFVIKGKISEVGGTKEVNTANDVKEKTDHYISDPTGTVKVTPRENFTISVQDGKHTFSLISEFKKSVSQSD